MACCCQAWCTTRHYNNSGAAQWQAPADDPEGSNRLDIDVDSSNNVYTVFSGVEKINSSGTRVYITPLDGRFGHRTLRCIAVEADGSYGYVGTSHVCATAFSPGYTGDNVYKVDLSDGSVVASASVGTCAAEINDACLDGNGGVYFGHTEGVAHFDSSFTRLDDVGCAVEVLAVCIDDEDNLWTAGAACEVTIDGCPVDWTVRKYSSAGTLLDGHVFQGARAIAWYNGHIYIGFRETNDSSPCNVVKITDDTLECVWSFGIGALYGTAPSQARETVRDIAANANGVYAVADKYLFQLADADGSLNWCRKNEGSKPDTTKVSKRLHTVAVASSKVWVVGGATPCNDDEEDACSSGSCTNNACACTCGEIGRRGGTLVKGCDCDEVPCAFSVPVTSDCASIDGEEINWSRDLADNDIQTWTGVLTFTCDGDTVSVEFVATNDCDQVATGGWDLTATISEGYTISTEILDWWCTDDAPAGQTFPGFSGTFTIGGLGDCCDAEVTSCLAFGEAEGVCVPTVDICDCTIPETLTATFSDGGTATAVYDSGLSRWNFSGSMAGGCGKTFNINLTCAGSGPSGFQLSGTVCGVSIAGFPDGTSTCDPVYFYFPAIVTQGDCCGSGSTGINLTITA